MAYFLDVVSTCEESIRKMTAKNPTLSHALENKVKRVLEDPQRFKPLHYPLQSMRRVHVLGSFVLIYRINEESKTVCLLKFSHHDDAYRC